jgi:glycerol uptake facilitator-like aquaporin
VAGGGGGDRGLYGSDLGGNVVRAATGELIGTFILVFAGAAVGFALAVGVFIGGPAAGGSVSPARTLGPMLVAGKLTSFWLYVLGPVVGAVVAGFAYDRFVGEADAPEEG